MKVNMTPNPLDVVTIHASQGDTEARQWEFELHNNGELIDTSDVKEQLVFKAYKGGTEQLLPENTSTPTTSPFKGDIKYPQGLLTDQEFAYRQSPAEEDGLAKITDIKGNTLVWNQLIRNGNFADTSNWSAESGATLSISNNIATISSTTANNGIIQYFPNPLTVGHKYLIKAEFNVPTEYRCVIGTAANQGVQTDKLISTANTWTEVSGIGTCTIATTSFYCFVRGTTYENVKIRNVMCFDLTQMGLDITDPSEFTSLFNLPYYAYNQGSLLSFMGNGIKTTGKNEADISFEQGAVSQTVNFTYQASKVSSATRIRCVSLAFAEKDKIYKCDWNTSIYDCVVQAYGENRLSTGASGSPFNTWFTVPFTFTGTGYVAIAFKRKDGANITPSEIDAIRPNLYLSDTESVINLPISAYFPSGMKQAGDVYDELTESKAISRIGMVDLGTITYTYDGECFIGQLPSDAKVLGANTETLNSVSDRYLINNWSSVKYLKSNMTLGTGVNRYVCIFNSSYTDATAFKTAMNGVYLYYELATPTETSFTTASLVTENGEVALANENGVLVGKCTEQLSENPGFIDAKIKLSDSDGECYSNKIQLHVERSPQ